MCFLAVGGPGRCHHLFAIEAHRVQARQQRNRYRAPRPPVTVTAPYGTHEKRTQPIFFEEISRARNIPLSAAAIMAAELREEESPESGTDKGKHRTNSSGPTTGRPKP